jgi:adenylate cyclase
VFFDLRNYTAMSRALEPEEIAEALRDYHAALVPLIFGYGGTIERFTGDGVLVIFNAPRPVEAPAEQAVRLALEARSAAQRLSAGWRGRGYELELGIAIDQDHATCGLIGSEGRFDYAAIGNVTNRGSRLCAEAKGGQILTTMRVVSAVRELAEAHSLGKRDLKGFSHPVEVFEVLALKPGAARTAVANGLGSGGAKDSPLPIASA